MAQTHTTENHRLSTGTSLLLLVLVVALTALPLLIHPGADFGGTDDAATAVISQLAADVQPWFQPLWEPAGDSVESLLFALQAAIGAGGLGYVLGYKRGQRTATGGG